MEKAFDAHFHLLPDGIIKKASFYNESWGGLTGHIAAMDEAFVGRALISYPTTDYHERAGVSPYEAAVSYNGQVAEIAGASGGRLLFLAHVPLAKPGDMISLLDGAADSGAAGLSMPTNSDGVYPDDGEYAGFFGRVEESGLPIFFHPTTMTPFGHGELRHPLITPVFQYAFDTTVCMAKVVESGLLGRFPRLKLVFASFGGAMPFFAGRFDRTYRMLGSRGIIGALREDPSETLRKIYVDTSGTASPTLLSLALEVFGEDRLLWGSDFPANREIAASIDAINALGISEAAKEKILGRNLEGILALVG